MRIIIERKAIRFPLHERLARSSNNRGASRKRRARSFDAVSPPTVINFSRSWETLLSRAAGYFRARTFRGRCIAECAESFRVNRSRFFYLAGIAIPRAWLWRFSPAGAIARSESRAREVPARFFSAGEIGWMDYFPISDRVQASRRRRAYGDRNGRFRCVYGDR